MKDKASLHPEPVEGCGVIPATLPFLLLLSWPATAGHPVEAGNNHDVSIGWPTFVGHDIQMGWRSTSKAVGIRRLGRFKDTAMKPLFTIHAGEFLVDCEIERKFRRVNVWIPAKDSGIDLLISNHNNTKTVSLQVKFSRDYLFTNMKDVFLRKNLRAGGWWTPTRQQIEKSNAQYWVFVLVGFAIRSTDFIIIRPDDLRERFNVIHGNATKKFQSYLWVTQKHKCYETRGLKRPDQLLIAENKFENADRDFTAYLNNWAPIEALNH